MSARQHSGAPKVAVVAEFYPSQGDPVFGVWAHRQAIAGIRKHFASAPTILLGGTPTAPNDAIAKLETLRSAAGVSSGSAFGAITAPAREVISAIPRIVLGDNRIGRRRGDVTRSNIAMIWSIV